MFLEISRPRRKSRVSACSRSSRPRWLLCCPGWSHRLVGSVFPNTPSMDDPKPPVYRHNFQPFDKRFAGFPKLCIHRALRQSQDGDAAVVRRFEDQRIAEIQIQSHKAATLATTDIDQPTVAGTRQPLLRNGCDIVSSRPKERSAALAKILVQLDLHADLANSTST